MPKKYRGRSPTRAGRASGRSSAINYRGYGASEGKPGESALTADALGDLRRGDAKRDDVDPRRIVVFGRSLGTAIAAHLAAERPVAGAILVSPYDSLAAIGRKHYPWLPVSLLLRHRFDALPDAKRNAHAAARDRRRVRFDHSARALARALRRLGRAEDLASSCRGADHNDLGNDEAFWQSVAGFLAER